MDLRRRATRGAAPQVRRVTSTLAAACLLSGLRPSPASARDRSGCRREAGMSLRV